jgi:hypothetical protein
MRIGLLAGVAALGLVGAGVVVVANKEPESRFCYADALIGPNGEIYGRGGDCQFVDEDGNLVTRFADGRPLCYAVIKGSDAWDEGGTTVDCDNPGPGMEARRPG